MTAPRYFLVTNDAARAALEIWCHPGNLPPSIAVVDDPDLMLKLPRGAQVRCYWYGTRATIAAWESWWTVRRLQGGFDWISTEDWDRIADWAEECRRRPALRLLLGIDIGAGDGPGRGGDVPPAAAMAAPVTAPVTAPGPGGPRWT